MLAKAKNRKAAKAGSYSADQRLLAHRSRVVAAKDVIYQRQLREYQREFRKLFSKSELRVAKRVVDRVQKEWHASNLESGSDSEERGARKSRARKKMNRALAEALPSFRQWQALKRTHLRAHRKVAKLELSESSSGRVHVAFDDILPTAADAQDFNAPFPVFDIHTIDDHQLITHDYSFVANDTGHMMIAFEFQHEENPFPLPTLDVVFGLNRPKPASVMVASGINFNMPRSGRLRISAVLQNGYSEVLYSLSDNFGFSYGELHIRLQLFIATMRGGSVVHLPMTLLSLAKESDGDDVSGAMSGLANLALYTVFAETEESVPQSDSVQILAGLEVHIESEVDDMTSHVHAAAKWQLKKITVGVI